MEFVRRGTGIAPVVALFPGAWNPPTRAHVALAEAALQTAGEVVFVLPRAFPHKPFELPGPLQRLAWLRGIAETNPAFSVAVSDGGLFIEMAREFRAHQPDARVLLLCGSDAARRIVEWEYPPGDSIELQLAEFELLVAPRPHAYLPPPSLAARVHPVSLDGDYRLISSTEARLRLQRGEESRSLIPDPIWHDVQRCYSP